MRPATEQREGGGIWVSNTFPGRPAPLPALLHFPGSNTPSLCFQKLFSNLPSDTCLWVQGQLLATILGPPQGTPHQEACQPVVAPPTSFCPENYRPLTTIVPGARDHGGSFRHCDMVVCSGWMGRDNPRAGQVPWPTRDAHRCPAGPSLRRVASCPEPAPFPGFGHNTETTSGS